MSKNPENQRKALGKGLSALLPIRPAARSTEIPPGPSIVAESLQESSGFNLIPLDLIDPNPHQPRTSFPADKLSELAQSIRANGIIQPLVVQRSGNRYQLVAGERRFRAAKLAEFETVPAVVQDFASDRLLEIALIENIQREDLNPIEVAQALDRLARDYGLSHEEIGQRTGKDRTTVTNLLRLLRLPGDIQILVAEQRLSMGHARAILGLSTEEMQLDVAHKAAAQGMSVRQVERLIQNLSVRRTMEGDAPPEKADPNVSAAVREMENSLGTRVRIIAQTPERGRIEIEYYSSDDLDRIYNLIVPGTP